MKLRCIFLLYLLLCGSRLFGQDTLKNLPEYSLPLSNDKLVIAHCMTNIIRFKGHPLEDSCNPEYYSSKDNPSAALGGLTQVKVMADGLMSERSLDEAVEFEMRAALKSGIDGFQFYYILGNTSWDDIILAYFRVAEKKNLNFKFTFCISHPGGRTEAEKITEFAARINRILNTTGRDNPHWLRTPDGRLMLYMWDGEPLADIPADKKGLPDQYYIARAYKRLADAVNERFACIFTINKEISKEELNHFLDYFPATWIWTLPYHKDYIGNLIVQQCEQRNRTFTGSVFNDFYTSKLLKKGTWDMYHRVEDAVKAGLPNVERKYITTGLSYNFRKLMEFGIAHKTNIINVITWNDYPEGHHLAPEINHNEGFSLLLNHYKNVWKGTVSPYAAKDVAIVFFKKYKHNIQPNPFNIPVVPFQKEVLPPSSEDVIELVTILQSSAAASVNGSKKQVPAGLSVSAFPMKTGPVAVALIRNNKQVLQFSTPEAITDKPYRSDRLTYTFSSEFETFYHDLYKDFKPIFSTEYNPSFRKE